MILGWLHGGVGWLKKLTLIVIVSILGYVIIRSRQSTLDVLGQLQHRLLVCTHQSESLATQLDVINRYRDAVERMIAEQRNQSQQQIADYEKQIHELNAKCDQCQISLVNCQQRDEQKTPTTTQLKNENAHYRAQIEQLQALVENLNVQLLPKHHKPNTLLVTSAKTPNSDARPRDGGAEFPLAASITRTPAVVASSSSLPLPTLPAKLGPIDDGHQRNEARIYAQGANVHFHRRRPLDEPLEFRRDGDAAEEPPAVADILPHDELVKKLAENEHARKQRKEASVEDFRDIAVKPDPEEADYKEIEH